MIPTPSTHEGPALDARSPAVELVEYDPRHAPGRMIPRKAPTSNTRAAKLRRARTARQAAERDAWRDRLHGMHPRPVLWCDHDCDREAVATAMVGAYAAARAEGWSLRDARGRGKAVGTSTALAIMAERQGQCGARAKSTGKPCRARGTGAGGRCKLHGGASTGPRTPEGKARALANLRRGNAAMSGGGKKLDGRSGHPNAPPLHAR